MPFFFDTRTIFGRAFIKLTAFISYQSVLAHRAKMLFGSRFILTCVYGGKAGMLSEDAEPMTILFRPARNVKDFSLWECSSEENRDCADTSTFREAEAVLVPITIYPPLEIRTRSLCAVYNFIASSA